VPKTVAPDSIDIPGVGTFLTNAVPDPFDERDLEYRPRLQPLPVDVDQRTGGRRHIRTQVGQSCTGHAVASAIDTVLRSPASKRVSPYMLYRLARRYDEFPGEADAGSSLRGAFKGWFNHGAALQSEWPDLEMELEPDLDDEENLRSWRDRPLGAFYRVNPFRLDDVQSAINELFAITVSSVIHDGWQTPVRMKKGGRELHVIQRPVDARSRGGHAYCLVGYNEVGFLVQNSWGATWGNGGFATLPYEDWLDSAYDAWVARPGVPQTPFYSGRTRTARSTGGVMAIGSGPDLRRLTHHVVNTGNDGRLSTAGKFVSSPAQLDKIVDNMERWHDFFIERGRADRRHVVLWSHGGGVSETSGLAIAQRHLGWWLNSGVYPVTFAWETGAFETLSSAVSDLVRGVLPAGGIGFDLVEQFDRLVEGVCRRRLRWAWREMKENARRASDPIPAGEIPAPGSTAALDRDADLPGASLLVDRLARYVERHGPGAVAIHLAAHSAGSVHQAAMLDRLADAGLRVASMTWLAPAITVAEFHERVIPHLGPDATVQRFSCFNLADSLELNDSVGPVYHKSAVYLVARGFEEALGGQVSEVPVLGLAKYWEQPLDGDAGPTLRSVVEGVGGEHIVARSADPAASRCDAATHAAFDEDPLTMTSLMLRIRTDLPDPARFAYQAHAPLVESDATPRAGGAPRPEAGGAEEPLPHVAETTGPGEPPLRMAAEAPASPPPAPAPVAEAEAAEPIPEVAVAPRSGSPILDVLASEGWTVAE
jgi:hypothetical protein